MGLAVEVIMVRVWSWESGVGNSDGVVTSGVYSLKNLVKVFNENSTLVL